MPDAIDATIAALRPTYLARRREELPLIAEALDAGDLRAAGKIGHRLAGSAATYGFAELTELGRALEAACIERGADEARAALRSIVALLDELDATLAAGAE